MTGNNKGETAMFLLLFYRYPEYYITRAAASR